MTDYREAPNSRVFLSEYDEEWETVFEVERALVSGALGDLARRIEHIGSTAVPGIAAKPIIDVLVTVESLDVGPLTIEPLANIGYEYRPVLELDVPNRRYFRKAIDPTSGYHLHMYADDDDAAE